MGGTEFVIFIVGQTREEYTGERMWSERLANNVIETDPLLPGKY